MTDLDAFVGSYPDPFDERIQSLIHQKWEFRELRTEPTEAAPKKGKRYKHQELIARLMRHVFDRLFLFHRTGTGKTMAAVAAAEYFRKIRESSVIQRDSESRIVSDVPMIERCYIIIKGEAHKEEFAKQILNNAEEGLNENNKIKKDQTTKALKRDRTVTLKKMGYHFVTYNDVKNMVEGCTTPNEIETRMNIRAKYSGCFWILDEAHNVKNSNNKDEDRDGQAKYDAIMKLFDSVVRSKILVLTATPAVNNVSEICDVINLVRPAGDKIPPELIKKLESLPADLTNPATVHFIRRYLNGVVSFVRELDIGVEIRRMGIVLPGTQTPVMVSYMATNCDWSRGEPLMKNQVEGLYQWDVYFKTSRIYRRRDFGGPVSHASTFVFPGELARSDEEEGVGKGMFGRFVELNSGIASWRRDTGYDMNVYCSATHLFKYSSKFASIINVELNAIMQTNPITKGFGPGTSFNYSEQKVNTGVYLLGLCFEANGIERLYPTSSVFTNTYHSPKPGEIRGLYKQERVLTIDKRPRYVILTPPPETPSTVYEYIMEVLNSYENRFGEYVMIIIGSKFIREAKSFFNIKRVHKPKPEWNRANDYQAESRAIRSTSHTEAIAEIKYLKDSGIEFSDNELRILNPVIEIYNHVAVCPPEADQYLDSKDSSTVDLEMYNFAYEKDIKIKKGERFLKIAAVDYHIHAERNMRPTDIDGNEDADYQSSVYPSISEPVPKEEIDMSTFEIYYASERIGDYMKIISKIFSVHYRMQVSDLIYECIRTLYEEYLKTDERERLIKRETKFVECAIAQLIQEKREIINSFGFISYLQEENDLVFLHSEFSMKEVKSSLSYYTENPIMKLTSNLETYVKETELGIFEEGLYEVIKDLDPESDQFKRLFYRASTKTKVEIIELALLDHVKALSGQGRSPRIVSSLVENYKAFILLLEEPLAEFELGMNEMLGVKRGRGRPKNLDNISSISRSNFTHSDQIVIADNQTYGYKGQDVIVHTLDLLSICEAASKSGDISRILSVQEPEGANIHRPVNIRILKNFSDKGYVWYTANNAAKNFRTNPEHNVYRKIFIKIRFQEEERMRDNFVIYKNKKSGGSLTQEQKLFEYQHAIFGSLFKHKNDFRVVMKRDEEVKKKIKNVDKLGRNSASSGKILTECKFVEQIRIAYYLDIDIPQSEYPGRNVVIREYFANIWNDPSGTPLDEAAFRYIYSASKNLDIPRICELIKKVLIDNNLVIYY